MDRKKFLSICKRGGKVSYNGHDYVAIRLNDNDENIYGHCICTVELKDDTTKTLLTVKLERVEECGPGKTMDQRGIC